MTLRPSDMDNLAAGGGAVAVVLNFTLSGQLNIVVGLAVGVLSLVVLLQRYFINKRTLRNKDPD
jgi:low affinity Fe/Cu permease|tara:strand:- start:690 stop:881 length:192 start_codon:yes stop_codon:yes gene_type:complete